MVSQLDVTLGETATTLPSAKVAFFMWWLMLQW